MPIKPVTDILRSYAERGIFQGFAPGRVRDGIANFRILWHRGRIFDLILDVPGRELCFASVLPDIPEGTPMYAEFREFVASRQSHDLPGHRRIDGDKVRVRCVNRGGTVSLFVAVLDEDYEYATRKLIQLVNEIYLAFLIDGPYLEYMVAAFNLDPDRI